MQKVTFFEISLEKFLKGLLLPIFLFERFDQGYLQSTPSDICRLDQESASTKPLKFRSVITPKSKLSRIKKIADVRSYVPFDN